MNALYKKSIKKSYKSILSALPIMLATLLLINILLLWGKDYYNNFFHGNIIADSFVGAFVGSFSFGIPVTSYVVGGELIKSGVSLIAVTAFIMTWSSVGLLMIPLESKYLGLRFAITRNVVNFFFSIIIAFLTVTTLNIFL